MANFAEAWEQALTALELDVRSAEQVLANSHLPGVQEVARLSAWRPPANLGPLPAGLLVRAQALVTRQRNAAAAITLEMTSNRRHLAALRSMKPPAPTRAVFVDVEG